MHRPGLVLLVLLALYAGSMGAASGERGTVGDPNGDGDEISLDVQRIRVANERSAVRVDVFVNALPARVGDITVYLQDERGRTVGVTSALPRPQSRTFVFDRDGRVSCRGLRYRWVDEPAAFRVRVPSACIADGRYTSLRLRAITEVYAYDADFAPKTRHGGWGWSRYFARARG